MDFDRNCLEYVWILTSSVPKLRGILGKWNIMIKYYLKCIYKYTYIFWTFKVNGKNEITSQVLRPPIWFKEWKSYRVYSSLSDSEHKLTYLPVAISEKFAATPRGCLSL